MITLSSYLPSLINSIIWVVAIVTILFFLLVSIYMIVGSLRNRDVLGTSKTKKWSKRIFIFLSFLWFLIFGLYFLEKSNVVEFERAELPIGYPQIYDDPNDPSIENEGIQKCEKSEDYIGLQSKYGEKNTWIKGYRVQDEELYTWLQEVDEGFYGQPGCLIVMNGMGEGKIIQLELENLEPIYEMDLEEFFSKAVATDQAMLDDFLGRLETSDEIEERVARERGE